MKIVLEDYQKELERIRKLLKSHRRGLSVTDISKKTAINRNSIAKYLDVLLASGQVEVQSFGKTKVYFLSKRIPIRTVIGYSSSGILLVDEDLMIIQANDTFLSRESAKAEDIINHSIEELKFSIFPKLEHLPVIRESLKGNEVEQEVVVPKDGTHEYYRVKCIPTSFENGSNGITVVVEDITIPKIYRKTIEKSEEFYRAIVEDQLDLICRFLPDRSIIFANNSLCTYLKKDKESLLNVQFFPYIARDDKKFVLKEIRRISHPNPVVHVEHRVKIPGQDPAWLGWHVRGFFGDAGEIIEYQAVGTDITREKQKEEARKIDLDRLIDLINSLPDPSFAIGNDGRVIAWNKRIEDISGALAEDMLGKDQYEYAVPFYGVKRPVLIDMVQSDSEEIRDLYAYVRQEENVFISESLDATLKGVPATLWSKAAPLYDANGEVIGAIQTIRDISDIKNSEAVIKQQLEQYRTIADESREGIMVFDQVGKIRYINPFVSDVLGIRIKEILGKNIHSFITEASNREFDRHMEGCRRGLKETAELNAICRDGHELALSFFINPLNETDGSFSGGFAIVTNVKDDDLMGSLQESEKRYLSLVHSLKGISFSLSNELQPIFLDGDIEALTGYSLKEFMEGKISWINIVHPDDRADVESGIDRVTTLQEPSLDWEFRLTTRQGKTRFVHIWIRSVRDSSGIPVAIKGEIIEIHK